MRNLFIILVSFISSAFALNAKSMDLSGELQQTLVGDNNFNPINVMVPGDVHSALLNADII